jgi:uncharacterized protein (DUF433 family)
MSIDSQHIESVPGRCGGKPCIVGTRIRVYDVHVWHELQGQSVDQIVGEFPQLQRSDVYAALAYFHDHRAEVMAQIEDGDRFAEELMAKQGPSRLQLHLRGDASPDALPPR